jgi:DNA helicase-2/ATP-dependent DNA helicase PcrA
MERGFLEGLNERQREAVETPDGPTLVLAGAGSGKTRVIVHRIAHLIGARSVPAEAILAVTFTNKAAEEMRRRVQELLSEPANDLSIHTFHALCLRLLRRFGEDAGLPREFVVYAEDDRRTLLRRICRDASLPEREFPLSRVLASVSALKNGALSPQNTATDAFHRAVLAVAESYQRELQARSAVDFDDLLLRGVDLLELSERARAFAGRRFRHVLVDEYQDTNRIQYRLLRLLAPHGNVFVVGDEDQSIYNFRGADLRNILDFERDFPEARVVKLEVNYRSTASILRAAAGVIQHNRDRKGKTLVAHSGEGERVRLREADDERDEAATAAVAIAGLLRESPATRIAVLVRTHAQTRVFEEELVSRNVPHQIVGGLRFYERREIKDALSYLRLLLNRGDDVSFLRVVNVPPRGVGAATVALIEKRASESGTSLWEAALSLLSGDEIPGRARLGLSSLRDLLERLSSRVVHERPSVALGLVLEQSGLLAALETEGGESARERTENLDELRAAASEYESRSSAEDGTPSLAGFLDGVSLLTDADSIDAPAPCLLLTIHAAKGLEFDAVFLAGLEEGLFPHIRSIGDRRALEEERRLFYVGLTRARSRLFLSYALSRNPSYQGSSRTPSRFLSEIPADALDAEFSSRTGAPRRPDTPARGSLRPGAIVMHDVFGEGRVIEASGSGRDRKVTVIFRKAGRKKLVVQYAKLEVVS